MIDLSLLSCYDRYTANFRGTIFQISEERRSALPFIALACFSEIICYTETKAAQIHI
jgi:hypothetical protein